MTAAIDTVRTALAVLRTVNTPQHRMDYGSQPVIAAAGRLAEAVEALLAVADEDCLVCEAGPATPDPNIDRDAVRRFLTGIRHRVAPDGAAGEAALEDWLRLAATEQAEPLWKTCDRCNYDRHTCPGCGDDVPHGTVACDRCTEQADPVVTDEEVDRMVRRLSGAKWDATPSRVRTILERQRRLWFCVHGRTDCSCSDGGGPGQADPVADAEREVQRAVDALLTGHDAEQVARLHAAHQALAAARAATEQADPVAEGNVARLMRVQMEAEALDDAERGVEDAGRALLDAYEEEVGYDPAKGVSAWAAQHRPDLLIALGEAGQRLAAARKERDERLRVVAFGSNAVHTVVDWSDDTRNIVSNAVWAVLEPLLAAAGRLDLTPEGA